MAIEASDLIRAQSSCSGSPTISLLVVGAEFDF